MIHHVFLCPSNGNVTANRHFGGYTVSNYPAVHGGGIPHVRDAAGKPGNGVFSENSSVRLNDNARGLSNTFLLGERQLSRNGGHGAIWMRSTNRTVTAGDGSSVAGVCSREAMLNDLTNPDAFSSSHPGGAHFATADGRVRFINNNTDPKLYERMGRIAK